MASSASPPRTAGLKGGLSVWNSRPVGIFARRGPTGGMAWVFTWRGVSATL